MEMSGPGSRPPVGPYRPASPSVSASAPRGPVAAEETVEWTEAGRRLTEGPGEANPLRAERLAAIRESIENGTYETTERLEAALSRFLVEVGAHP